MPSSDLGPIKFGQLLPELLSCPVLPFRGGYTVTMREDHGARDALANLTIARDVGEGDEPYLHVGWGSFRNLDIVAARRSAYAIICDISLRQLELWSGIKMLIKLSETREVFVKLLTTAAPSVPRLRRHVDSLGEWLETALYRPGSWLADSNAFLHIRDLVIDDRMELLSCDLRDSRAMSELARSTAQMRAHQVCKPDTLYLSNVPWMMMNLRGFFGEEHSAETGDNGFRLARLNLQTLALAFRFVVSAHRLAPSSSKADMQWETNIYSPGAFLDDLDEQHQQHSKDYQTYRPGS